MAVPERQRSEGAPRSSPSRARAATRALPAVTVAIGIVAAAAYVLPRGSRNPLVETTLWSLLVVASFAGWGSLVRLVVAPDEKIDLGLRAVWGASVLCALGGLLSTMASMGRATAFVLVEVGLLLAIAALAKERGAVRVGVRTLARLACREPRLAALVAVLVALLGVHYLAGVSEWHTNPYDDDIAYLSFVRKLLDTGTVLEPFSLRRLSALGGQTFFIELVSLRAAPSQGFTFDRSVSVLMVAMLIAGHRSRTRRLPLVAALTTITFVLVLPNLSINTASYYSGVAFFLGLLRTMMWLDRRERTSLCNAVPIALVAAAACTLRQNYIAVPPAVLALMYAFRLRDRRGSLKSRLAAQWKEPALAAGIVAMVLVPWFVVGYQSNRTFFYPLMLGTANPAMQFQSGSTTAGYEVYLQIWTLLEGLPFKTIGISVLAIAVVRETEQRRPLTSYLLGCAAGFVALVHGLTQGDASTIGRYAVGFLMVIPIGVVLVSTTTRLGPVFGRPHVAAGIALFGVLAAIVESRVDLHRFYFRAIHNIEALEHSVPRSPATDPPEVGLYHRLQDAVPPGARIAVMLDEPYHLDYGRNPIWNLDMPGYSSLAPGMPYFQGDARVEEYLKGLGVRYLAYVRMGYSRYHYRREYWVAEVVNEMEVWRDHAPYVIDFIDNLTALDNRHRRAFEERGLVVIDLEAPR